MPLFWCTATPQSMVCIPRKDHPVVTAMLRTFIQECLSTVEMVVETFFLKMYALDHTKLGGAEWSGCLQTWDYERIAYLCSKTHTGLGIRPNVSPPNENLWQGWGVWGTFDLHYLICVCAMCVSQSHASFLGYGNTTIDGMHTKERSTGCHGDVQNILTRMSIHYRNGRRNLFFSKM